MSIETQAPAIPMVTLTIDDKEVTVPKGTLLIEAARGAGIDIPYLCYHHKLTPFGGCRLCLVEVEKSPKMLAACNSQVADGMIVRTTGERVQSQRQGSLEFILLNHPLDCPVCDKGGECELQDRVFQCGSAESRMTEPKVHIEDYDLGPLVVRNQDRCIVCKRCIKVMEEIVGDPVIEFGQRGVTTEVYTFEHSPFKPGFAGNTIPVCPVGALLSKPFRFKARPWELIKTPSICSLCSMGCNIRQDVRENRLLRVVGLENTRINDGWLCDRGQFGYDYVHSAERLRAPLLRKDGKLEAVSWDEALDWAAAQLTEVKRDHGPEAIGFLGSERASNEDNFVLQQFARQVVGTPHIDHRMGPGRSGYAGARPSPGAIDSLPKADVVLLAGCDLTSEVPVLDLVLKRSLLKGKQKLILLHPRRVELQKFAHRWLRCTPGSEIAAVNALVMAILDEKLGDTALQSERATEVEAIRRGFGGRSLADTCSAAGLDEDAVRLAAREFAGARLGSIIYSRGLADTPDGESLVAALSNLALLSGQSGRAGHVMLETVEQCNTWGARDMGALPDSGAGYASAAARGLPTPQMLRALSEGRLRALFVMAGNPLAEYPDAALAEAAVEAADLLIVQDLFMTETAARADLVLPAVAPAEENATLTNVEGRVQRTVRALDPLGASKPEWQVLCDLAQRMGASLGYTGLESVQKEIRASLASVAEAAGREKPGLVQVDTPQPAAATEGGTLHLITAPVMFNRDTIERNSTVLTSLAGEPYVEVHPETAAALGLAAGGRVIVRSAAGGELELALQVSDATPPDAAFVPAGFNEAPVNRLLTDGQPVTRVTLSPAGSAA